MTEFDPDTEVEPEEEVADEAPEQSSNRTFILVAVGLGGLFVIGLVCIGLYVLFLAPGRQDSRNATLTAIASGNEQIATGAVLTAVPFTETPTPTNTSEPTDVILITDTPVFGGGITDTPLPTDTEGPSPTPSRTPTKIGGSVATAVGGTNTAVAIAGGGTATTPAIGGGADTPTPTRISGVGGGASATPTKVATTPAVGGGEGLTRTPTPTALPDTGIADNLGGPGLFIAAIVLVAVVFFARQLRLRNS